MKVISAKSHKNYKEVILEDSFLWWKKTLIYRMYSGSIFLYKFPDTYNRIGGFDVLDIKGYFDLCDKTI